MAYRVIKDFADLEDQNHRYTVGDEYPRCGLAPTKERIVFLLSSQNLLHTPVIEEVVGFDDAMNEPVEQGTVEQKNDGADGAKTAVKAADADGTVEYKPKRTRRSKTANKG